MNEKRKMKNEIKKLQEQIFSCRVNFIIMKGQKDRLEILVGVFAGLTAVFFSAAVIAWCQL